MVKENFFSLDYDGNPYTKTNRTTNYVLITVKVISILIFEWFN